MNKINNNQSGFMLLEALLGILIFSMGILAMVGMQAAAISAATDAQYRSEAASLANQIVSRAWVNIDRTTDATAQASLNTFRYNTGVTADCVFSGGAVDGTNTVLSSWVDAVTTTASTRLPGAAASMQQITVDTSAAGMNLVTVTVCWKAPSDARARKHVLTANVT